MEIICKTIITPSTARKIPKGPGLRKVPVTENEVCLESNIPKNCPVPTSDWKISVTANKQIKIYFTWKQCNIMRNAKYRTKNNCTEYISDLSDSALLYSFIKMKYR